MGHEDEVAIAPEAEAVAFPVAKAPSGGDDPGPIINGNPVFDQVYGIAAAHCELPTARFAPGQQAVEIILLGHTVIDKTIDRFMTDCVGCFLQRQPASNLFRRPTHRKALLDIGQQVRLARQLETAIPSAATICQLIGPHGIISAGPYLGCQAVASKLPANCRLMAAKLGGNETVRLAICVQTVNLNPVSQDQL